MSNYPPGVSGREPQIAGYDEHELEVTCGECDHFARTLCVGDRWSFTFTCEACGEENEVDCEDYYAPDPDAGRDE